MVWRFPRYDNEIKYGAKLIVREGQAAAFVNEGKLADVFQPGTYTLETQNLPILSDLRGWKYGFRVPVQGRGLLRRHARVHRPQVGHEEPDHAA